MTNIKKLLLISFSVSYWLIICLSDQLSQPIIGPFHIICIILARKGSKRIKNKNLVKINGTPLIEYTLNSIKKLMALNNIFISTNDTKIMKVAKKHNINIVKRPAKLCRDSSSSEDGLIHAIKLIPDDGRISAMIAGLSEDSFL